MASMLQYPALLEEAIGYCPEALWSAMMGFNSIA